MLKSFHIRDLKYTGSCDEPGAGAPLVMLHRGNHSGEFRGRRCKHHKNITQREGLHALSFRSGGDGGQPCLQRMLLELQRYDISIKYRPGKEMQLANALSRCPVRASQEISLDMQVDYIAFTKPWIEKLKDSTQREPILAMVYQLTQQGWPHQRRHIPHLVRRYWDFRDELSTDDGMLLKGLRLIIPGGTSRGVSKPSS